MNQSPKIIAILFTVFSLGQSACSSNSGTRINTGGSPGTGGVIGGTGGTATIGGTEKDGGYSRLSDGGTGSGGAVSGGNDAGIKCKNEDDHECGKGCCPYGFPFVCEQTRKCYKSESAATTACEGAAIVACKFKGPYFVNGSCANPTVSGGCLHMGAFQGNPAGPYTHWYSYVTNIGTDGTIDIPTTATAETTMSNGIDATHSFTNKGTQPFIVKAGQKYIVDDGASLLNPSPSYVDKSIKCTHSISIPGMTLSGDFVGYKCYSAPSVTLVEDIVWGTTPTNDIPVTPQVFTAQSIAAGDTFTCALVTDGTVQCWGENKVGNLGNGTTANSPKPVAVSGITNAVAISSKWNTVCALLGDGTIQCWGGSSGSGLLGNGTKENSSIPVTVSGITNAVGVYVGTSHACARLSGGKVTCWGSNYWKQLGNGGINDSSVPVPVYYDVVDATSVAVGSAFTCVTRSNGVITCWGQGFLGCGSVEQQEVCSAVSGIDNASNVVASGNTCAIHNSGQVSCWGSNKNGELGSGESSVPFSRLPVTVRGITKAIALSISHGYYEFLTYHSHTCALLNDGIVQCWGANSLFGMLGDGTTENSFVPVTVSGITNAIAVAAGALHTCAVLSGGAVRCWGSNTYGQLGNGTNTSNKVPVQVAGF